MPPAGDYENTDITTHTIHHTIHTSRGEPDDGGPAAEAQTGGQSTAEQSREQMSGGQLNLSHCRLLLILTNSATRKCQSYGFFAMSKSGARGV